MDPKSLEAARGVAWFAGGWQIVAKSPVMWVLLSLLVLALVWLLRSVAIGGYVLTLFAPALGAGLLCGAADVKAGKALGLNHLLLGFTDQTKFTPLLIIGVVSLVVGVLSELMVTPVVGPALTATTPEEVSLALAQVGPGGLLTILLALTLQLVATALVYFAVPLVMFRAAPATVAMQSSLRACLRNALPLFVFSLIYLVPAIVAIATPYALGWVVLLPWSIGMLYCSYEDIYPA
jgi:hypothetical protein